MSFVVFFKCKQALAFDKKVLTKEGQLAVVMEEPEGWVPATSAAVHSTADIPRGVQIFLSKEKADTFMKKWKGHPWYYVPNGEYEVIEVVPRMVTVQKGWEHKPC